MNLSEKESTSSGMQRGLKNRHIQLIALGGAIGTGLFYGSATTIKMAGPAIILSYFIGGVIIYWIMRQLGEMSVAEPVSGSFSYFASKYWGDFPGFLSGWNYWILYVIVSMAELTAVGIYVHHWWPEIPTWLSALVFWVLITTVNLSNVKMFGELEFWFALIKVLAIIGMIIFGLALIFLGLPGAGLSNLWSHGGFFPNGVVGVMTSLVIVMFSFGGIELIGITAGEADNPKKTIPMAINQVMWRILIFYIGALIVLLMIYPWNQIDLAGSPFVQIFSKIGIPAAANILNIVVLTAALSVYNSGLYSNSRMLYNLAVQGSAPEIFSRLNKKGVPVAGVLASSLVTLITVFLNYIFPGSQVFIYIMAVVVLAVVISWVIISITHLYFRKAKIRQNEVQDLSYKSPWYPVTNYICLAFMALIVGLMSTIEGMAVSLYIAPAWLIVIWVCYKVKQTRGQ